MATCFEQLTLFSKICHRGSVDCLSEGCAQHDRISEMQPSPGISQSFAAFGLRVVDVLRWGPSLLFSIVLSLAKRRLVGSRCGFGSSFLRFPLTPDLAGCLCHCVFPWQGAIGHVVAAGQVIGIGRLMCVPVAADHLMAAKFTHRFIAWQGQRHRSDHGGERWNSYGLIAHASAKQLSEHVTLVGKEKQTILQCRLNTLH